MKFRLLNRLRASWGGYFWLPCPLCGQMMGGHEWKSVDGLESSIPDPKYPADSGRGIGICQDCTRAGKGYHLPMRLETVECRVAPHGNHYWCRCFGDCPCNKAICNYCGAERPLTRDELAVKQAPSGSGSDRG